MAIGYGTAYSVEENFFTAYEDAEKMMRYVKLLDKNSDSRNIMKTHPEIGYRIAMSWSNFEELAPYILSHHERWDGNGYPRGLRGKEIPLLARILAVADAYDAMTSARVYRKPIGKQEAMEEIRRNSSTQFDPAIVNIFLEYLEKNEP
jgi:HD-GYP domain-containing protein (c-di-GMP phosphodiesterase class II)